jgi:hypothetical protein
VEEVQRLLRRLQLQVLQKQQTVLIQFFQQLHQLVVVMEAVDLGVIQVQVVQEQIQIVVLMEVQVVQVVVEIYFVHPVLELQDQQVQEIHLPLLQLKDLMEEYTHLE